MNCSEFEILLCDYVDDTLRGEQKSAFEHHLETCGACAELARDAGAAVRFMERASAVEPPPELVTKILFELPQARPAESRGLKGFFAGWSVTKLLGPVLQPRFAMGMAMTILSFSMLAQVAGISVRQLRPSDLDPIKIAASIDLQLHRGWERAVKYYENLRVVYEIQSRLKEWTEQQEEERRALTSDEAPAATQSEADSEKVNKGK